MGRLIGIQEVAGSNRGSGTIFRRDFIKQLYNINLQRLPIQYRAVSVMRKGISERTHMYRTVWVCNYTVRLYAYGLNPTDEMLRVLTNGATKR